MASTPNSALDADLPGSQRRPRRKDTKTHPVADAVHLPSPGETVFDGALTVADAPVINSAGANGKTATHRQGHANGTPVSPRRPPHRAAGWYGPIKGLLDFVLALLILLVSAPFVLVSMLLIKLTSRGPALYKQVRVGLNGRPFTIFKLRTMRHECESLTGAKWSTPGDTRITPVGRFLRATHLDELPQLWNVLRGEMSLVGPRPERPEFVPQLERAIPHYRTRLRVRPGLTGLAQVQLPPDTNLESVRLKLAYDVHYVQTINLWLDLRLLAATALKVVGVPFPMIRRVVRLPGREVIQQAYQELVAREPGGTKVQAQSA